MKRPCNKCSGKGTYRADVQTYQPIPCTRCNGTGVMDRVTKAEKRRRKLQRRDGCALPR